MPYGLSQKDFESIRATVGLRPGVDEALLFGSRAMGTHSTGSDIDIALKGRHLGIEDILRIRAALNDLDLLYSYDVINYNSIGIPELKTHIDRYGITIFKRPHVNTP